MRKITTETSSFMAQIALKNNTFKSEQSEAKNKKDEANPQVFIIDQAKENDATPKINPKEPAKSLASLPTGEDDAKPSQSKIPLKQPIVSMATKQSGDDRNDSSCNNLQSVKASS